MSQSSIAQEFLSLWPRPTRRRSPSEDPRAIAVQLFTSGTTGKPKAAILRHENLMSYIVGTVEFGAADEDDAILVTVPPYHIAGISSVLSSTYACRRMVQLESFEPAAWLDACREQQRQQRLPGADHARASSIISPTRRARLPALRALAYGGGKMPLIDHPARDAACSPASTSPMPTA